MPWNAFHGSSNRSSQAPYRKIVSPDSPPCAIKKKGGPSITLTNATVPATNPQEFGFPRNGGYTCFLTVAQLAPKQSCTLLLEFEPASTGSKSSSVTIIDNASNANQVIQMQGVGK